MPSPLLDHLLCKTCSRVPNQAVELTNCRHLHCKECILGECNKTGGMACSCNSKPVKETEMGIPSALTHQLLQGLLVRCMKDHCSEVMELRHLQAHLSSNCTRTVIPNISVQQLLDMNHSSPSQMTSHFLGNILDKALPASGSITYKAPTGKVSDGIHNSYY